MIFRSKSFFVAASAACLFFAGCSGGGNSTSNTPQTYTLTINSSGVSAVAMTVAPRDNNGLGNGNTSITRVYNSGTSITVTAPGSSGSDKFSAWTGCTSVSAAICTVTLTANTTITAAYTGPTISSVTVTPGPTTATIGATKQFTATVAGTGSFSSAVTWSVTPPSGWTTSAGSIDPNGLYETPYPAPATVTVTATSTASPGISGSSVVTLNPPPAGNALALSVDAANITHPINPYIYGWDGFYDPSNPSVFLDEAKLIDLPINRYGGDGATRYNYKIVGYNSASDYWYQNNLGVTNFDDQVTANNMSNTKTIGTMPLIGWTMADHGGCSYSVAKYGPQQQTNPSNSDCGNGVSPDGSHNIVNDPTDMSFQIDDTWTTGWMQYLVGKFKTAANGGVAVYNLDNEPTWWDAVHKDAHGSQVQIASGAAIPYKGPFSYDEVTTKGLQYAAAIKAIDPTAEISGPVLDSWMVYFFSKKDVESGWSTGPCYCFNGNPVDRLAHGDIPFIEYYLQQFAANDAKTGFRSLDYLDIHGYYAAHNAAFSPAGDTALQAARLDSTRAFWDPTYTDTYYTDPNTPGGNPYPLQLIPMLKAWVAKDYPGTKTSIDEYNWGGQEHINGALAQADILGIFGREGLDLGALWGTPDPVKQVPGLVAFEVYRNYDGSHSKFGDQALLSTSANQGQLAVYGALRSSDQAVTIVVINKTFGDLPGVISLPNLVSTGNAKAYLYNNANIAGIAAQPDVTIAPAAGGKPESISQTFPAASITVLVIPTK